MEQTLVDKLVHASCRLKCGVQLNDRIGPEQPLVKFPIDPCGYLRVSDYDETARVVGVVGYQTFTKVEDVDWRPFLC